MKITQLGRYRLRNGDTVVITKVDSNSLDYPVYGYHEIKKRSMSWTKTGLYWKTRINYKYDIVELLSQKEYLIPAHKETEWKDLYQKGLLVKNLSNSTISNVVNEEWELLLSCGIAEPPIREIGWYWVRIAEKLKWRMAYYSPKQDIEVPWWFPLSDTRVNEATILESKPVKREDK